MNRLETQTGLPLTAKADFKTGINQNATPVSPETEQPLHNIDFLEGQFRIRIDGDRIVAFRNRNGVSIQWKVLDFLIDHPGSSDSDIQKYLTEQGHPSNAKATVDTIRININREFLHTSQPYIGAEIIKNDGNYRSPLYRINAIVKRVPSAPTPAKQPRPEKKKETELDTEKTFDQLPHEQQVRTLKSKGKKEEIDKQNQIADKLALERLSLDVSVMFLSRIIVGTNPDAAIQTDNNAVDIVSSLINHPQLNASVREPKRSGIFKRLFPNGENDYKNFILGSVLAVLDFYSFHKVYLGGRDQRVSEMCQELKVKGVSRADILEAISTHLDIELNDEQKQEAQKAKKRLRPLLNKPKSVHISSPRPEGNKSRQINTED